MRCARSPLGRQTEPGTRILAYSSGGRASKKRKVRPPSCQRFSVGASMVCGCQTCSANSPRVLEGTLTPWKRVKDRKSTRLNPVTNAHLVCRLLLEKKNKKEIKLYNTTA